MIGIFIYFLNLLLSKKWTNYSTIRIFFLLLRKQAIRTMKKQRTIVVVDDNKGVLSAVKILLKNTFDKIVALPSPVALPSTLREERPDVVLLDMNFGSGLNTGNEGLYWLHEIKRSYPSLPVVLFTAYGDIDLAVRGIKEGASDFIVKPWDNKRLVETLLSACEGISKSKKKQLITNTPSTPMYWGDSKAMTELRKIIERVAKTDANVLITSENGTGKEVVAHLIHENSLRAKKVMVEVNCAAIPSELIESELFGHTKGSFTSAIKDRAGKFEQADGGTLFLDEIGDMSLSAQAKVLRALQENEITRVGSDKPIKVNVRVLAATNKDLKKEIAEGRFREDLYHRLNVIPIHVPSLDDRKEDIPLLIKYFVEYICQEQGTKLKSFSSDAIVALQQRSWSGNIRELRNVVERLIILSGDTITIEDVEAYGM